MKKRLIGLALIIAMVLGLSMAVYADDGVPFPRPPRSISVEINEVE